MPITCPANAHVMEAPAARVGLVIVCPICGRSAVLVDDNTARIATAADTTPLTEGERDTLRQARPFDRRGRARR